MRINYFVYFLVLMVGACKKEKPSFLSTQSEVATKTIDSIPDGGSLKLHIKHDTSIIDETVLLFQHTASSDFIPDQDARYFQGFGIAAISSITNDNIPCAIQTLPYRSNLSLKLGIGIRQSGTYMIGISSANKVPAGIKILLIDSLKHDSTDLRSGDFKFSTSPIEFSSPNSKRFNLLLK